MPIPSKNFSVVILLCELDLQCKLIARTAERLRECADHWIAIGRGIDDGKTAPPIEIISLCSVCLSAAAAISRLLLVGDRKGKKAVRIAKRCEALMALLEQPALTEVRSIAVRNSWEHLDERLDDLLSLHCYSSYSQVHVAVEVPKSDTFALRHFDPVHMAIRYGPDAVPLAPLIGEVSELSSRVSTAFKRLHTEQSDVY